MRVITTAVSTLASFALLLGGCAEDATLPPEPAPLIQPVVRVPGATTPVQLSAIAERYDVTAFGPPLGVAVVPETGQRLVLSSWGAIYELGDESGEPIWMGVPLTNPEAQFTDLAALDDGKLALTSWSDGYILDVATGELSLHFCYEPGWWEPVGTDPIQLSFSVAHDRDAELIYAQPRTIDEGGFGPTTESFVASYDEAGGADLDWWAIDDLDFIAGGMVVLAGETTRLVMGANTELFVFDVESSEMTPVADLTSVDVVSIGGLALDADSDTLLVADPGSMSVVEIRLDALGL